MTDTAPEATFQAPDEEPTPTLAAVPDLDEEAAAQDALRGMATTPAPATGASELAVGAGTGIPTFEGLPIGRTVVKTAGVGTIDMYDDVTLNMDDRIRVVGVMRVSGVRFTADKKTGELIREHLVSFVEMTPTPFDPNDPTDDGIVRMARRS